MTHTRKRKNSAISSSPVIQLRDPIESHFTWSYQNHYSENYLNIIQQNRDLTQRTTALFVYVHNVTRTAMNVPVLINFFRRYEDSITLSDEDIKLLQITVIFVLFFYSGNTNEPLTVWNQKCANALYLHLITTLGVDSIKAQELSKAVANIDTPPMGYIPISHKIIHDALYLDKIQNSAANNFNGAKFFFTKTLLPKIKKPCMKWQNSSPKQEVLQPHTKIALHKILS